MDKLEYIPGDLVKFATILILLLILKKTFFITRYVML